MRKGTKIEKFENPKDFISRIKQYSEDNIVCTQHTLFRLSEKQRKIFTCNTLKKTVLEEIPILVGIQLNGNFAVYYNYKEQKYLKIIISFKAMGVKIITFYIVEKWQLPRSD